MRGTASGLRTKQCNPLNFVWFLSNRVESSDEIGYNARDMLANHPSPEAAAKPADCSSQTCRSLLLLEPGYREMKPWSLYSSSVLEAEDLLAALMPRSMKP